MHVRKKDILYINEATSHQAIVQGIYELHFGANLINFSLVPYIIFNKDYVRLWIIVNRVMPFRSFKRGSEAKYQP